MNTTEYKRDNVVLVRNRDTEELTIHFKDDIYGFDRKTFITWNEARILRDIVSSLFEDAIIEKTEQKK